MTHLHQAKCHCGNVAITVKLSDGFKSAIRCNCSYCRMRGAVEVSVPTSDLTIIKGKEYLSEYRFNTGVAKHYFCSCCGIYTHHQKRSDPSWFGVNVAILDGVSPFNFSEIQVVDGNNHSLDNDGKVSVAGRLNYVEKIKGI